jgi:nucleoside phosphorylase
MWNRGGVRFREGGSLEIDLKRYRDALQDNYVLIFTSNSKEKAAVNRVLRNKHGASPGCDSKGCSIGKIDNRFVVHVTGDSGVSQDASLAGIANAILKNPAIPQPSLVLLVGFCWGSPASTRQGTVVISDHLIAVNSRVAVGVGEQLKDRRRASMVTLSDELRAQLDQEVGDVVFGAMLSAETLYCSDVARNALLTKFQDAVAGEMEAFGFIKDGFRWLIVKAVSDNGGDDFDREAQNLAAERAASAVPTLLRHLEASGELGIAATNAAIERLEYILQGDAFDLSGLSADTVSHHLDMQVGPWLEQKLRDYATGGEANLKSRVLAATLEIALNAFKHGRASCVSIQFAGDRLIMSDDGRYHDVTTLQTGRGGARALADLKKSMDDGSVFFRQDTQEEAKGNRYVFRFLDRSKELSQARSKCSLEINYAAIGRGSDEEVFSFDPDCRAVYLDASRIRMPSRRFDLAEEVSVLLDRGIKVYVGCQSEDDAAFFREELGGAAGENLVIFCE